MLAGFCQRKHNPEINEDWFALRRWTADIFRNERPVPVTWIHSSHVGFYCWPRVKKKKVAKIQNMSGSVSHTVARIQLFWSKLQSVGKKKTVTDRLWGRNNCKNNIFVDDTPNTELNNHHYPSHWHLFQISLTQTSVVPWLHMISDIARMFPTSHQLTQLLLKRCRHFVNVFLLHRPAPNDSLTLALHTAVSSSGRHVVNTQFTPLVSLNKRKGNPLPAPTAVIGWMDISRSS